MRHWDREGGSLERNDIHYLYLQELRRECHLGASCHHQNTPKGSTDHWLVIYWQNSYLEKMTLSDCHQGPQSRQVGARRVRGVDLNFKDEAVTQVLPSIVNIDNFIGSQLGQAEHFSLTRVCSEG